MARSIGGPVVVITGASGGIGRATALEVARRGGTVVLAARRGDALEEAARECRHLGAHALPVPTDVASEFEVQVLLRAAIEAFGRIDVWVNNAAVTLFGRIEDCPPDDYERVLRVNLFGYIHGARAVIPHFRSRGRGVLINVSSVAGIVGQPLTSAYCASKAAIIGWSECLREELADQPGIGVCTVLPASIDTPLFQQGANYTGRMARPMPPVYAPEVVARTIAGLMARPRRQAYAGAFGRVGALAHGLAPELVERVMARQVPRRHFDGAPDGPASGNLFEPMAEWACVEGGWRERRERVTPVALAGLAGLGLAAGWLLARQARRRDAGGGTMEPITARMR